MRCTLKSTIQIILLILTGLFGPPTAESADLPRVHLIATGGTISNRASGRLSATELIRSVPALDRYVQAEAEDFTNIPSSLLTLAQWLELSKRINDRFEQDPNLAGIVVTSGTDTLEETAYFLHLTIKNDRPVVVVGSMRSPDTIGYDGQANLLQAFRVAAEPDSKGRGVLVVLNNEINSAREATKTNAQLLQTFQTRGYGVLGVIDSDRVIYYRSIEHRHTIKSEFNISNIDALPRIDILMMYQDAPGDLIRASINAGAQGIVIAGAGAGLVSADQQSAIRQALDEGIFIVFSTRTGSGRVPSQFNGSQTDQRVENEDLLESTYRITGEDLAPLKARILLMLALTKTSNSNEVQRMFMEY